MKAIYPLVSIIIPTYKRADKLERAIESVLNQTYPNIEVLVIDDNGPFSRYRKLTKQIMLKYEDKSNIKYICHEANKGGAQARNTGIKHAQGEFIAFLDDDDEFYSDKIEMQYTYYQNNKNLKHIGVIYCHMIGITEEGKILYKKENRGEGMPLYENMLECIANTSTWFLPKEVLENVGGFEETPSKQDTIMLFKIMSSGYEVYCVDKVLLKYYEHNEGRISGLGENKIIGENNAREYARSLYDNLKDKQKIRNVEASFSEKLLVFYLVNDRDEEAKVELYNIFKNRPFCLAAIKSVIKYIFKKQYIRKIIG